MEKIKTIKYFFTSSPYGFNGFRGKLEKNTDFSTVLHTLRHAQAASAVWASPTIEGDPRRALQALGMTDTDRVLEKSVCISSLPLTRSQTGTTYGIFNRTGLKNQSYPHHPLLYVKMTNSQKTPRDNHPPFIYKPIGIV